MMMILGKLKMQVVLRNCIHTKVDDDSREVEMQVVLRNHIHTKDDDDSREVENASCVDELHTHKR
jgi:hypothetical protein